MSSKKNSNSTNERKKQKSGDSRISDFLKEGNMFQTEKSGFVFDKMPIVPNIFGSAHLSLPNVKETGEGIGAANRSVEAFSEIVQLEMIRKAKCPPHAFLRTVYESEISVHVNVSISHYMKSTSKKIGLGIGPLKFGLMKQTKEQRMVQTGLLQGDNFMHCVNLCALCPARVSYKLESIEFLKSGKVGNGFTLKVMDERVKKSKKTVGTNDTGSVSETKQTQMQQSTQLVNPPPFMLPPQMMGGMPMMQYMAMNYPYGNGTQPVMMMIPTFGTPGYNPWNNMPQTVGMKRARDPNDFSVEELEAVLRSKKAKIE